MTVFTTAATLVGMKTMLMTITSVVCALALLAPPAAVARSTGTCLRDAAGYATYNGGLAWNTEFFLSLAPINESDWYGDWDYYARRYDAYFNVTYFRRIYVSSGWAPGLTYATSSNTNRRTTIATATTRGIPHWAVSEYGTC